ncbi:uncharacterized protein LOC133205886 [Saccostrea echinata]|uniref:uncharacterized protein LOC133205886 n=1 Tax=Saccostrea echinata TaxID=191078 RepID=UPI002A81B98F|nr:uncharacterized protein LOC133205886 [Saccostrea echinata]
MKRLQFIIMHREMLRPSTAGAVSRKHGMYLHKRRPKTSIYRKKRQELLMLDEETEIDSYNSHALEISPDEAYDSDSTVCASEFEINSERSARCSAASSSTGLSSSEVSDGNREFERYIPHDYDMISEIDGLSVETGCCRFGLVPMRFAAKRIEINEPENCHCLSNMLFHENNAFSPWKTSCRHKSDVQTTQKDNRNSNPKQCQVPSLYRRTYGQSSKSMGYPFSHFENSSKYIQQYKELCSSVGKFRQALEVTRQNKVSAPLPDPYLNRLRSTACSIAENFDIFAILDIEKDASDKDMSESDREFSRSLTVNDRGKNLNLAPVRDSPPLQFSAHHGTSINKNDMRFNQYLNLVIPKTALHKTNIQLNLDNPKEMWTPRFESKRNPTKNSHRRSESVDSLKRSTKHADSSSRRSSGANRASQLRLERAATSADGTRVRSDSGCLIPPPPPLPQSPSILTKRKTQSQKTKCVNQIRAMLSDLDDCKGKLDRTCRRLENIKHSSDSKSDRVLPATKTFGIEGQTCRTEDQLSIIHRLRKEKERTLRVSAVN